MDNFMTLMRYSQSKNLVNVPLETIILGEEHPWQNQHLDKGNFYTLPEYRGTFKLISSRDMGYYNYIEHSFKRENAPEGILITKLIPKKIENMRGPRSRLKIVEELKMSTKKLLKSLGVTTS